MNKVGSVHQCANREFAVAYAASILRHADDWQEAQHAIADHPTIGPWVRGVYGRDSHAEIQGIIRDAEDILGADLPY